MHAVYEMTCHSKCRKKQVGGRPVIAEQILIKLWFTFDFFFCELITFTEAECKS